MSPDRTAKSGAWPEELRLSESGTLLTVRFNDGTCHVLSAEFLRVESPSAEVKGHGPGQAVTVSGKRLVKISRIEPVGNYAVRLIFSDGHSTGLYSWDYIERLGRQHDDLWAAYLERLTREGLERN